MVRAADDCVCVTLTRSDDAGFRERVRLRPGQTVLKIGRAPECQVNVSLPGVSVFHAEIRALDLGEKGKGLSVRDLSTNGTGLQVPGGKKTWLKKEQDTALPDGAMLVVPMNCKKRAGEDKPDAFRIWVTVRIEADDAETPCLSSAATLLMPSARAALKGEHAAAGKAGEPASEPAANVSLAQPSESKKMKIRAAKKSRSKPEHSTPEDRSQGHLTSPPQTAIGEDPLNIGDVSVPDTHPRAKGRAQNKAASSLPAPAGGEAGPAPGSPTPVSPTVSQKTSPSKSARCDKSAEGKSGRSSSSPSARRRRRRRRSRSGARAARGKSGSPGRGSKEKKARQRSSRSRSRGRRRRSRSRSRRKRSGRDRGRRKPEKEDGSGAAPPMMSWPAQTGGQWPWPGGMAGMATGMPGGMPGGATPWTQWGAGMGFPSTGMAQGPAPPPHLDPMTQQIYFMYQRFNPMKLPQLDSILEKYKGIEHKLLQALNTKYLGAEATAPQT